MNHQLSHDESQYVFASLLAVDLRPYKDFVYLQTPYYPLLLSIIFSFTDEGYFQVARVTTFLLSIGSFCLIFQLSRRITGDLLAATALAILFLTSEVMLLGFGTARNDIMPCFFALLGVYMVYEGQSRILGRSFLLLCGGAALAAAVGTKISYAFVPLAAVLYSLWPQDGSWARQFCTVSLPLMFGGLLGALPLVYFAWLSFDNFLYDVFVFPTQAVAHWYENYHDGGRMSLKNQLVTGAQTILSDGTTGFCAVFLLFFLVTLWSRRELSPVTARMHARGNLLFVALAILSIPTAMAVPEAHKQYFIPTVPFILLAVAALYTTAREFIPDISRHLLIAGTIIVMFSPLVNLVRTALSSSKVEFVNSISSEIRGTLTNVGAEGKVATLSPQFVIDSEFPVYKEFAAGPFFFRTGDMLSSQKIKSLNGVSPKTLHLFLDNDPPAAVFIGFEKNRRFPLDGRLKSYAQQRGYVKAEGRFGPGHLYLHPSLINHE